MCCQDRCKAWLISTPRSYPRKFLCCEIFAHVASWLLQIAAGVCQMAGLVEHTKRFGDDLVAVAVCIFISLIVLVVVIGQVQLIIYRYLQFKNGFILASVMCVGSGIIYLVEWVWICRLTYKTYHISHLLLGLPSILCVVSMFVFLGPALFYKCCHGENDVPQQEVLLQDLNPPSSPPPTYEEAIAQQAQQGQVTPQSDRQPNPYVQPPPYSPRRDPSIQPPPYSQSCSQSPSQQSSSSPSRNLRPRPPSTSRKDTEKKWPRVDYDNDDENGDKKTKGSKVASQRRPRQGKSREGRGNTGKTRIRSRSRSGGRSLGRGRKTRSRERTRSRGAGRSRERRAGGGKPETTKHAVGGPRTRSRSLRRRTIRVV